MATVTASLTLSSSDLTNNGLSLVSSANIVKAGTKQTGLDNTSGVARKTTTSTSKYTLFRADDYTNDKAHKVYLKNTSSVATEYFIITLDDEEMGRLYAGDFAFFPWSAKSGTKEEFTVTFANTWAAADTFVFDGVTVVATGSNVTTQVADIVSATFFPNWTVTNASGVCTFVSRYARADLEIDASEAAVTTAGDGTGAVATTVEGLEDASNILITPSVATTMTLEHTLLYEI